MSRLSQKVLLFANAISMAHPTRMWKIACDLESLGYQVHFATSETYFKYLLPANPYIQLYPISSLSSRDFNDRLYRAQFIFKPDELIRDTQEDSRLVDAILPDVILGDFRQTAYIPARMHGIPFLNVNQCHWSAGFEKQGVLPPIQPVRIFGRTLSSVVEPIISPFVLRAMLRQVNEFFYDHPLARKAGLGEFKNLSDFYLAGDHALFADLEDLYPDIDLPDHHHFIGPIIWHNAEFPWPDHWPTQFTGKPVAYLSMGSTGAHHIVPQAVEALRATGYQVLLSSSGYDYKSLDMKDVYVAPFVPIDKVLRLSDLVVCNGGTGTTYHALSHGVPIISVPQNMDQSLHGVRLQKAGVCRMVFSDQASTERLTEGIYALTHHPDTQRSVHMLQQSIARLDQRKRLQEILERL